MQILVVEDDQLVQAIVEEALSEGGFETTITASGEEAIAFHHANKSQYRAIVTDINVIGRFDGWAVARTARETEPTIPVIYMTGTPGEEWASKGVPNSVLLTKPFAPAQLVTALSNLLKLQAHQLRRRRNTRKRLAARPDRQLFSPLLARTGPTGPVR